MTMKTTSTLAVLTFAAVMGATSARAQTAVTLDALTALFVSNPRPTEEQILAALATDNLTVQRVRIEQDEDDNEVRVRAVTPDGQTIRIEVEDGDISYRIGLFGDTSDVNGDISSDLSDDNGDDTSGTSDDNSDDTSDDNSSDTSDSNDDSSSTSDSNSDSSSDSNDD